MDIGSSMSTEDEETEIPAELLDLASKKIKENIIKKIRDGHIPTDSQLARLYGSSTRYIKTQVKLAEVMGVDRKTIKRWREDKTFPDPMPDGRWDVVAIRDWRERKRNAVDGTVEEQSKAEGEARRVWLQVQKLEHDLEIATGSYMSVEEVQSEVARMVQQARTAFLALPDKLAPIVIGMKTTEAHSRIREEIDYCMGLISKG